MAGQSSSAGTEEMKVTAKAQLWEGVRESRHWPLQGFAGRAATSLKHKLLTHSCSKSHSSSGTVGWPTAGNHLVGKVPIEADFTDFRLLLRYLDACGRKPGCFFSDKKKKKN